jgi:acetyl esterase/lipase
MHGGGYVLGDSASHRLLGSELAKAAASELMLLDYPLAPEHPFPAPVEAALDLYLRQLDRAGSSRQIALSGNSAGAGLALATILAARDRQIVLPAACVVMSPWVDLTQSSSSFIERAGRDPFISKETLDDCASSYLAGTDPRDPWASPLFADLTGLPPTLIQVGTEEVLFDDAIKLTATLRRHGVAAQLSITEDAPHVWHQFVSFLPEARISIDQYGAFLERQWADPV